MHDIAGSCRKNEAFFLSFGQSHYSDFAKQPRAFWLYQSFRN